MQQVVVTWTLSNGVSNMVYHGVDDVIVRVGGTLRRNLSYSNGARGMVVHGELLAAEVARPVSGPFCFIRSVESGRGRYGVWVWGYIRCINLPMNYSSIYIYKRVYSVNSNFRDQKIRS